MIKQGIPVLPLEYTVIAYCEKQCMFCPRLKNTVTF